MNTLTAFKIIIAVTILYTISFRFQKIWDLFMYTQTKCPVLYLLTVQVLTVGKPDHHGYDWSTYHYAGL